MRPADPRHSIDICVRDPRHRVLFVQEAWNTFGDLGAAIRSTNRKTAEATDLAATLDDGPPYRVATLWIVRPSAPNRALVRSVPADLPNVVSRFVAILGHGTDDRRSTAAANRASYS